MRDILLFLKRSFQMAKKNPVSTKMEWKEFGEIMNKKNLLSLLFERKATQKNGLFIRKFNKTNGERKVRDDRIRTRKRT